ncbi:restriction endonuclease subunit S [Streptococcus thermophilus]
MTNSKHLPKRRFKEFELDGEWEETKLRELFQYIGNAFVGTATPYYVESGHFYLESNNIKDGQINYNTEVFINDEFYQKQKNKWLQTGDMVMVQSGHVGHAAVIPENLNNSAAHALIMFRNPSENLESHFLNYQYQTTKAKEKIKTITTGNTIQHILASDMKEYKVYISNIKEQLKIGKFFQTIDSLITLHQHKLDKLKNLKKAYLSEMFPAEGERVPKRRFPGFEGEWEEKKLFELADVEGGGTPSTVNPQFWDGDIDWYTPAEIDERVFVDRSKRKITNLGLAKSSAKMLPIGTVLFTSRAGIGKTAILAREGCTNQGFQSIIPKEGLLDSYFIYSLSNKLKSYGERIGAGSTFVEVSGKQMSEMSLIIPSIFEQKQIGNFFNKLDQSISLQQQKLDKLNDLKKAYLNELFV